MRFRQRLRGDVYAALLHAHAYLRCMRHQRGLRESCDAGVQADHDDVWQRRPLVPTRLHKQLPVHGRWRARVQFNGHVRAVRRQFALPERHTHL